MARQFHHSGASTPAGGFFSRAHVLPKSKLGGVLRPHSADPSLRTLTAAMPGDAVTPPVPNAFTMLPDSGAAILPQGPGVISLHSPVKWQPLQSGMLWTHGTLAGGDLGVQRSSASAPSFTLRNVTLMQQLTTQTPTAKALSLSALRAQP